MGDRKGSQQLHHGDVLLKSCPVCMQDQVMVIYTVSYPPRLIPVSLVLPGLDVGAGIAPQTAPTYRSHSYSYPDR